MTKCSLYLSKFVGLTSSQDNCLFQCFKQSSSQSQNYLESRPQSVLLTIRVVANEGIQTADLWSCKQLL